MSTDVWKAHNASVEALSRSLKEAADAGIPLVRGRSASEVSHVTRGVVPGKKAISFRSLNKVIEVNALGRYAWVEPGVTMEELVRACLACGCVPAVVPECKGITIGGAIMGAGLESGSFAFGQFNDIFTEYEVLLADGRRMLISSDREPDLFYGLAGSYGTLANLTCAKLSLVPAEDFVRLDYLIIDGPQAFCERLSLICGGQQLPDYIDAMQLVDGRIVMMLGHRVAADAVHRNASCVSFDRWWAPWFAQYVIDKASENMPGSDFMTTYDYLFRYDRGAFWMGQFVTSPGALLHHLCEWRLTGDDLAQRLHAIYRRSPPTLNPGALWRALLGWKVSTRSLYRVFHRLPEKTRANLYLVQDFYIPTAKVPLFLQFLKEHVGIYPLWLCPVRGTGTSQLLCPHSLSASSSYPQPDFVNVGVYGIPVDGRSIPLVVKDLEQRASDLGGRKVLYSFNFYSRKLFGKVYNVERYRQLRQRYGAEGRLPELYDKVVARQLVPELQGEQHS